MKIKVENLGPLRQAEFELGDMTIICGGNNTGKTYATYALFGFLSFWRGMFSVRIPKDAIGKLIDNGTLQLNLNDYTKKASDIINTACEAYNKNLPMVFGSSDKLFADTKFSIILQDEDITPLDSFELSLGSAKKQLLQIAKGKDDKFVTITLLVDKTQEPVSESALAATIGNALKDIIFGDLFRNPFIASAERTGAAIFRKELDFARNRFIDQMSTKDKSLDHYELLNKVFTGYALPVRVNVDFTRQLENISRRESFIAKDYPDLLNDFTDIIGGEYKVVRDELFYVPNANKRIKLNMDESSSAVRSLLDIGFYLRHSVEQGDLLIVDEPELNLHPENQRRMARLFARLVNTGVKVFITTHSDYIIKELNTLIMLNRDLPHLKAIQSNEGYKDQELLVASKIKVFIAEKAKLVLDGNGKKTAVQTLVPADIDQELGIEARSFDITIDDMNRIQETILFSGEE